MDRCVSVGGEGEQLIVCVGGGRIWWWRRGVEAYDGIGWWWKGFDCRRCWWGGRDGWRGVMVLEG